MDPSENITTEEWAATYVREHYENQLADQHDLAVEDLTASQHASLLTLVADETTRLHRVLVLVCDAWATDADTFDPEDYEADGHGGASHLSGESPDPDWMNP